MLHFEGDKTLPLAPAEAWNRLSDASFLAQCIPDVQSVTHSAKDQLVCKIKPGFSFARGTLDLSLRVADALEGKAVRLVLSTKGIGTSSAAEVGMHLAPHDGDTCVHWTTDVLELGGLLKAVPRGLIRAAAERVIAEAWKSLEARLGT